jgi:phosphoserine phosphatase
LVVFDLDGTLTTVDSLWRYLHDALGTWEKGKAAAQRYREGKMTYQEWAETDAACWERVPLSRITQLLDGITYREGAREVFQELKSRSVKTAIVSAGLSLLADRVASELGADLAVSNELECNDGHLTGRIKVKVEVNNKKEVIEQVAGQFAIPLKQIALVGDQAFDLSHPECLRIAFRPKDNSARHQADFVIEDGNLMRILQYVE